MSKLNLPEIPTLRNKLEEQNKLRTFSTGSFMLDCAIGKMDPETGLGGVVESHMVELFGHNSTGKTLVCEHVVKNVLDRNPEYTALWIAAEQPIVQRMEKRGIDLDRLKIWEFIANTEEERTAKIEEALALAQEFVLNDPNCKIIVIDSIRAMTSSKAMYDDKGNLKPINENPVAARANLVNDFICKFPPQNKSKAILLMTNHLSASIGPSYTTGSNFKHETPGGRATKFLSKLRVKFDSIKWNSEAKHSFLQAEEGLGLVLYFEVIKNQMPNPDGFRTAVSKFSFRENRFMREYDVFQMASYIGLIEENSPWFTIDGQKFQGEEKAIGYLKDNEEVRQKLEKQVLARRDEFFEVKSKSKRKARELTA